MGLGSYGVTTNSGNNNNKANSVDKTYYSRLGFRNYDENNNFTLSLSVQFTIGLMKIKVDEKQGDGNYKELENICLSASKALMLAEEIKKFKTMYLSGKHTTNMYGINGGMKEIISFLGIYTKDNIIYIRVGKFRADSGEVVSQVDFNMNNANLGADEWDNFNDFNSISVINYPMAELDQLIMACEDFARFMSGAAAYSVLDLARYDAKATASKFDQIFDKLGIERYSAGNGGNTRYGSSSFLTNAANNNNGMYGGNNSVTRTLDSIEDMIDED